MAGALEGLIVREMYVATEHSRAGTFKTIGVPVKLSETPGRVHRAAPTLGQHTEEILGAPTTSSNRSR